MQTGHRQLLRFLPNQAEVMLAKSLSIQHRASGTAEQGFPSP